MSDKRETAPKIGLGSAIKSFFTNEITIGESEVSGLLSELELSLLEADVTYDVSLQVTEQLRTKLVGMKVPKGEVESRTKQAIIEVLAAIMDNDKKFLLPARVRELARPAKILFVGPNGAGKTTTMAKVARMLMDSGLTVMFSASDTFRAAAIEQAEVHAGRLGVSVVKSGYGADPSSVAFDAINFARSHNIDVVLIDSAGRQDTNVNLLDELKKMNRVAKPDLKIYIGESIGGNSIIEQIGAFNEAIGIDGAILTKLDCDAKGGTAISVSRATGIPILYLGVGQGYNDLVAFDPGKIAREIMN
jgi:fused signal recognition particle receptor